MNFAALDRRIVYLFILISLAAPLVFGFVLPPAPIKTARDFFGEIDKLASEPGKFVLLFFDFGPNSKAENFPQTDVVLEHLFRKRVPFAIASQYSQAEPLLESIPSKVIERLQAEIPSAQWVYGKDWVNLGYRVGGSIFIRGLADSNNLSAYLKKDARGNVLSELEMFRGVTDLRSVQMVGQFSSLTGTLDTILQFFQSASYRPPLVHGCTSITIPQAYIFLDSGQLTALLEGIAGAASYSELLTRNFVQRGRDTTSQIMTGLGVAHLVVIALVVLGNIVALGALRKS